MAKRKWILEPTMINRCENCLTINNIFLIQLCKKGTVYSQGVYRNCLSFKYYYWSILIDPVYEIWTCPKIDKETFLDWIQLECNILETGFAKNVALFVTWNCDIYRIIHPVAGSCQVSWSPFSSCKTKDKCQSFSPEISNFLIHSGQFSSILGPLWLYLFGHLVWILVSLIL